MRLKDTSLQAAGLIFIAKPSLMVRDDADHLVSSALAPEAFPKLRMRALANLNELLKVCFPPPHIPYIQFNLLSAYPLHYGTLVSS